MADASKGLEDWLREREIPTLPDVDVVYGGAFSIKDYYMESGNPRQMRGASQLLLEAADAFEGVRYFACGAESFLIVPRRAGKYFASVLEQVFREKTLTAQAAAVWRETTVGALLDTRQFNELWKELNKAFGERRMLLFLPVEQYSGKRRCERCNFRDALANKELCASCANKADASAHSRHKEDCLAFGKRELGIALEDKPVQTLQDLADGNGDMALFYGDINDLGWAGRQIAGNVEQHRLFTCAVKETIKSALFTALIKAAQYSENKAFEIIAVGGDDICVLLPGEVALLAGTLLLKEFDACWKKCHAAGLPMLTISAGIAVGQANTPILYMRQAAEQLLKLAKDKADAKKCSCLDILSLNSDGQWATSIEKKLRYDLQKSESAQSASLTMRPFTVDEAARLLRCLHKNDISASTLHNIAEASLRCGIAEGDLWFRYLQTRQNSAALNGLAREYDCYMYSKGDATAKISPWRDLAELRGQRGGDCL